MRLLPNQKQVDMAKEMHTCHFLLYYGTLFHRYRPLCEFIRERRREFNLIAVCQKAKSPHTTLMNFDDCAKELGIHDLIAPGNTLAIRGND